MTEAAMTKTDFAWMMGVDRAQPTRWVQMGMPVLPDGRVDPVEAAEWVRENVDSTQRDRRSVGMTQQARAERRRRIVAYDEIGRLGVWLTAQITPRTVAVAAIEVGIPLSQVRALYARLLEDMPGVADDIRAEMGLPPGASGQFKDIGMKHLEPLAPDWEALAASVPVQGQ